MADLDASWHDHEGRPTTVEDPPGPQGAVFYEPIGDFQGAVYRRNAFARGTEEEVAALQRHLAPQRGTRWLDVGCGDGRHLRALAREGVAGVGVDISRGLLQAAARAATDEGLTGLSWVRADARRLPVAPGSFDVATSLCQGGFGTGPASDPLVLSSLVAAVRSGGRVAFTAFHALFAVRNLVPGDAYDVVHGVHHHRAEVVGPDGRTRRFPLWTSAYTVGEAVALAERAGLEVLDVVGVEPGRYGGADVSLDDPELLVVGRRRGDRD